MTEAEMDEEMRRLHHITTLPKSIRDWNLQQFSVQGVEESLHARIRQHTARDSDRFRQVFALFKHHAKLDSQHSAGNLYLNREDFHTVLSLLGLFATPEQAGLLFDRYDSNHDGKLTVHEFLTQARPHDYTDKEYMWHHPGYKDLRHGIGKRQFQNTGLGDPVRSETPQREMKLTEIFNEVRSKQQRSASSNSSTQAKRALRRLFQEQDVRKTGSISMFNMKRAFDSMNIVLGAPARRTLMTKYEGAQGRFSYVQFVNDVYPNKGEDITSTSLDLGSTKGLKYLLSNPSFSLPPSPKPTAHRQPKPRLSRTAGPAYQGPGGLSGPRLNMEPPRGTHGPGGYVPPRTAGDPRGHYRGFQGGGYQANSIGDPGPEGAWQRPMTVGGRGLSKGHSNPDLGRRRTMPFAQQTNIARRDPGMTSRAWSGGARVLVGPRASMRPAPVNQKEPDDVSSAFNWF